MSLFGARRHPRTAALPETYLGYAQGRTSTLPTVSRTTSLAATSRPSRCSSTPRALTGNWTIEERASVLNEAEGRIAFRFHARDVHLVLRSRTSTTVPFRVLVDGEAPGPAHGLDVDEQGREHWSSRGSSAGAPARVDHEPHARGSHSSMRASRRTSSPSASDEARPSAVPVRGPVHADWESGMRLRTPAGIRSRSTTRPTGRALGARFANGARSTRCPGLRRARAVAAWPTRRHAGSVALASRQTRRGAPPKDERSSQRTAAAASRPSFRRRAAPALVKWQRPRADCSYPCQAAAT